MSAVLVAGLFGLPQASAQTTAEQRAKVRRTQSRIAALEQRLSELLAQHQELSLQIEQASTRIGITQLRLHRITKESNEAAKRLQERARFSYKYGGLFRLGFLLASVDLADFFRRARLLRSVMSADQEAYQQVIDTSNRSSAAESTERADRSKLFQDQRRLDHLADEIMRSLERERAALDRDRATLAALEAARRDSGRVVSAAVEARRTARQKILDAKLLALLEWIEPATGTGSFMPPNLKGTGIESSGLASWYGPGFHGRRAASGATYLQHQLTAAHRVLPHGTLLRVSFRSNVVVVVVTDRGPYIEGRVLDLSAGAAEAIGMTGVKEVTMEIVVPKDPTDAPPFP